MRQSTRRLGGALLLASLWAQSAVAQDIEEPLAPEPAVELAPRFESRVHRDRELLAETYPGEARRLATAEGELLVLFKPALHAEPKGALLIAYTGNQPGDWPAELENLRRSLPYYGWATLALALPPEPKTPVPPRPLDEEAEAPGDEEGAEAPGDEPEEPEEAPPEEPDPPRAQRLAERLDAALALLAQEGQLNLVVLVDNLSASDVHAHLRPGLAVGEPGDRPGQSPLAGPVRALILLNLYPQQPLSEAQLRELFSVPELPILNLFPGMDSPPRAQQRRQHRGLAQQQRLNQYQALVLPFASTPDLDDRHSHWVQRIQSFMAFQARGVERLNPQPQ